MVDPGLVVVDKAPGMTSHDVVARVRRLAGTRKVGHAGTLDPMATGVLVLGVDRATRLLGHLMLTEKAYDATVRLGVSTTTDDAEGEVTASTPASHLQPGLVQTELEELVGDILQVPTAVSAIKVDGKRAYQRVRDGEQVELKARPVTIHELVVHDQRVAGDWLDVDISVRCSSGTYIRAIARDVGAALGVGGHLTALRRTAVGSFDLSVARTLEQLADDFAVLPIADAARASFASRRPRRGPGRRRAGRSWARPHPPRGRPPRGVRARRAVPRALRAARAAGPAGGRLRRLTGRRSGGQVCPSRVDAAGLDHPVERWPDPVRRSSVGAGLGRRVRATARGRYGMSIHRIAALGASIMVLTAGALTGGTAGAAGQAAPSGKSSRHGRRQHRPGGRHHDADRAPPGVTTFKITTTRRQAGLQLVAFAPGYTVEQATLDVENGLDKNRIKALKRFEANTTLLGGASASRDKAGKLAVDLEPGTYYAVDSNKTGSPWLQLSVGGVDTGASMKVDATLTAVDSTKWAKRPAAIPRNGWLRFRNRADQNHFVIMVKLLPGKTLDDFAAFLEKESGPPPVDFRSGLDSGVLSPGHDMAMKYRLPKGNYVLTCFWPDASMGGMPHAFMGMYRGHQGPLRHTAQHGRARRPGLGDGHACRCY